LDILTLNCGSSSVKYQVYDWDKKEVLANGAVERIGQEQSTIEHNAAGKDTYTKDQKCPEHKTAIKLIMDTLVDETHGVISNMDNIQAVGHRVVQGGDKFNKSVIIDDEALQTFREVSSLAPLHNPANIQGIEAAREILPHATHCAVMDTAWHQTMPKSSYMYALPYEWYEKYGVRKYGFHGTSFLYVAKRTAALMGRKSTELNAIVCHIGNGASICAIKDGVSYDTSMGLTPLEGLVMGTRSGDFDPAIIFHILNNTDYSPAEIEKILNKKSGVLGVTGQYIDRRDIEDAAEEGDERAQLAMDLEAYRLKKYIGAYATALGRVDALVFTAGVGEMSPKLRRKFLDGLEILGIKADLKKNDVSRTRNTETELTAEGSSTRIFVVPTDEELVMTEDAVALMNGTYDVHTNFTYSFQSADYVNQGREERLKKELEKKPGLKDIVARPPKG
jgi:acetate kinase